MTDTSNTTNNNYIVMKQSLMNVGDSNFIF